MAQTEFSLPSGKTVNTCQCYRIDAIPRIPSIQQIDTYQHHSVQAEERADTAKCHPFHYPELKEHGNHAPSVHFQHYNFNITRNNCYFTLTIKPHRNRNVRPLLTTFQNKSEEKKSLVTLSIKTTYFRWQTYVVIQVNEVNQIIWLFNFSLFFSHSHTCFRFNCTMFQ